MSWPAPRIGRGTQGWLVFLGFVAALGRDKSTFVGRSTSSGYHNKPQQEQANALLWAQIHGFGAGANLDIWSSAEPTPVLPYDFWALQGFVPDPFC